MSDRNDRAFHDGEYNTIDEGPDPGNKRLRRSKSNKVILGVCGGISNYLEINPVFLRIFFSLSIFIGGWGLAAYIITGFLLPPEKTAAGDSEATADFREIKSTLGALVLFVGIYFLLHELGIFDVIRFFGFSFIFILPLTLIAAGFSLYLGSRYLPADKLEIQNFKFVRSSSNKRISGICGGLSDYLRLDPSALRAASLLLLLVTGGVAGVIYLIMLLTVPPGNRTSEDEEKYSSF